MKISGIFNGENVTITASKVAICLGPWTKKFVDPLLSKKGMSLSQLLLRKKKNKNIISRATTDSLQSARVLLESQGKWDRGN